VKTAQDEASSTTLHRETPEEQNLLLAESKGLLLRKLPEAHEGFVFKAPERGKF
jgi:hypothetical protein